VESYKCKKFGHMAKNCRMTVPPKEPKQSHKQEPQKMTWIRKKDQYSNEECSISLQAKQKKCGWYVDSGCSKHMTGYRDKFVTLQKERDGLVSFENDDSSKIIGK
jgi:hypothetical protein